MGQTQMRSQSAASKSRCIFFRTKEPFYRFFIDVPSIASAQMGIAGLLPLVDDATEIVNIKQYKGKRIAVDASTWLHRGDELLFPPPHSRIRFVVPPIKIEGLHAGLHTRNEPIGGPA